jgi:sulfate adenylyltransferase subunit 1
MEVLKIATAGSVDDGKSTLIGRILYDTKSLTDDKLEAIQTTSEKNGLDYLDFSLATDGLVAEREQGITIDVAHIYFSTERRSYIIADTPGHIEYTRNMVTGASTSQASIILVDARNGVIEQTSRHFYINNLLRIKNVIVAVNKMDLVDFSEEKFNQIKTDILALQSSASYKNQHITFIPISALHGDNVVNPSRRISWYDGITLMDILEQMQPEDIYEKATARFPIQTVIRPKTESHHDFRGYAGKLYGSDLTVGDQVQVLPSGTKSTIKEIHFFNETYKTAKAGSSINITLADNINVSRGDMIVKEGELPQISKELSATVCWMDKSALRIGAKYHLQHGIHTVLAKVNGLSLLDAANFASNETDDNTLTLNQIGEVQLKLNQPIYHDIFSENKENGSFILIDCQSHTTAGVGFISG